MAVIYINRSIGGFYSEGIVELIRIVPFKNKIFVVVPQGFEKAASGGKKIKNPVEPGPFGPYILQGKFCQFLDIAVKNQKPTVFIVIVFQYADEYIPVGMKIIPPPPPHVKIADDKDFATPGNVQHSIGIKAGAQDV
jgi:hypothetical protein